jgi:hypothetical protein
MPAVPPAPWLVASANGTHSTPGDKLRHAANTSATVPTRMPNGTRSRQAGEKREYWERHSAPRGALRYFFAGRRWFPTPAPAAQDTVRPSARNYRPRNHARRCETGRKWERDQCRFAGWIGQGSPRERDVWPVSRPVARLGHGRPPTTKRPDVRDVGRWGGTPVWASQWRQVAAIGLLEPGSLPLLAISQRIARWQRQVAVHCQGRPSQIESAIS